MCDPSGTDEDCDGLINDDDPSVNSLTEFYFDGDGDGFGADRPTASGCLAPPGYVPTPGDCDDADPDIHPDAPEPDCADPIDRNCDGSTGYADADLDGWAACEDCDDGEPARNPGAAERCDPDDLDEDCDGLSEDADPSATGQLEVFTDADLDGFGDPSAARFACDPNPGEANQADDCDDTDPTRFPGAPEPDCADPIDRDCDGATAYADADLDGWAACVDCDDADEARYPGADERIGDGRDQDCDGGELCLPDADGDGVIAESDAPVVSLDEACDGPGEAAAGAPTGDCDDSDPQRAPGLDDVPGDGLDQDCDGLDAELPDSGGADGADGAADGGPDSGAIVDDTDGQGISGEGDGKQPGGCGCGGGAPVGGLSAGIALLAALRRRRR